MHSIQGVKKQDPTCLALPWIVSPLKSSNPRWILRDPCQTRMRKLRWEQGSERWAVTCVTLSSPGMIVGKIDTTCSPRQSIKEQFLFFLSLSSFLSSPLPSFLHPSFPSFLLSFNWISVRFFFFPFHIFLSYLRYFKSSQKVWLSKVHPNDELGSTGEWDVSETLSRVNWISEKRSNLPGHSTRKLALQTLNQFKGQYLWVIIDISMLVETEGTDEVKKKTKKHSIFPEPST